MRNGELLFLACMGCSSNTISDDDGGFDAATDDRAMPFDSASDSPMKDSPMSFAWSPFASGTMSDLHGIWGSGANDVWAVGDGVIVHWDGLSWKLAPNIPSAKLRGVWGSGPNDVWAVGTGIVLHWDGQAWTNTVAADGGFSPGALNAVWGSGPKDVWGVGYLTIAHFDGSSWVELKNPNAILNAIWGSGPKDVWAACTPVGPHLMHWDGNAWSDVATIQGQASSGARYLYGIWGSGANDIWAVGGNYNNVTVVHSNGGPWTTELCGTQFQYDPGNPTGTLFGVWGSAANDIWAVGEVGDALPDGGANVYPGAMHYSGGTWTNSASGTSASLTAVWGSGANDVWAVGRKGVIVHHP